MSLAFESAAADSQNCFENNGQNSGFEAEEHRTNDANLAKGRINPAQKSQCYQTGKHEQRSGENTAAHTMHQPANVDSELMRFRARKQHAVVERVKKSCLAYPV